MTEPELKKEIFRIKKLDVYMKQMNWLQNLCACILRPSNQKLKQILKKMKLQRTEKAKGVASYLEEMGFMIACEEESALEAYQKAGFTKNEIESIQNWWIYYNRVQRQESDDKELQTEEDKVLKLQFPKLSHWRF